MPLRRSLRAKFITVIVIGQILLMGLVATVIAPRQRQLVLQESHKRAVSLARHLAALSTDYLLSYDFVKLEQTVGNIAGEDDVAYAIVHLHDGKVAAYSGHSERQGSELTDAVSQQAIRAESLLVQDVTTAELRGRGYDVAIPIQPPGGTRSWGTIRLGLSLDHAVREMRKTTQWLWWLSFMAVGLGTTTAVILATRIVRPVRQLVLGVNAVAQGQYDQPIGVTSQDDIGYLARRFEQMRDSLRQYIASLDAEKQRLELSNHTLRETQRQLIKSERAVGNLAAKVAHEVNNPLAIVKTSIHLLKKVMPGNDPVQEQLDVIGEEVSRVARIIRQLLDFARPAVEIVPVQINEEINKIATFVHDELTAHGITLDLDLATEIPAIRVSPDHLKQVLLNLIKNAQDAMPQGGTLSLRTGRQADGVTIDIRDTGIGIPATQLEMIFEPFFSTKKDDGAGLGLGLAISHGIIKSYGGSITVDSQVGQGTTFHLFLPERSLHHESSVDGFAESMPLQHHEGSFV